MQRPIQFWFRGRLQSVSEVSPTRTVLQWLREDVHATGSKEGCGEGDCGACTVTLGELDDTAPGGVRLRAVNSCIQFLPTLDGKALFTVEDLAGPAGSPQKLHPVQQAMVDCHGSQCGFCTPGFVMSLWADYESRANSGQCPTRDEINDTLSGNLCRCTGYRPIVDAAQKAWDMAPTHIDRNPIREVLETLSHLPSLDYSHNGQRFQAPHAVSELGAAIAAQPDAQLLSGSTDIGLWVTKHLKQLGNIIYLGACTELKQIDVHDDVLEIGAGVTLTDAFAALVADEPAWGEQARRFASTPVRNAGTLGGNVANGSPIGDSMPGLIALGTRIVLQHGARIREMPLDEFYLAYQKTAREPGEFVRALKVPRAPAGRIFRSYKVSKRQDQDISAVSAAFALFMDDAGRIGDARVAFGGMAATPKRAAACEAALRGQAWSEDTVRNAMAALDGDYAPLSDMRASSAYRSKVARNLLWRMWLETESMRGAVQADVRLPA
ncbi:MAG: xanthine dehydrogenase small subunit [Moraxellaceae bacterium]|nr:xanthine dehydrogenase small subunit [Moraxellaceae bacterium]